MGALLFIAGIVLIVLGFNGVEHCGVIGVVVLFLGIVISGMTVGHEETKARINRRRYWAYGERPRKRR